MDADGYVTGFTRGAPPPGGMVKVGVARAMRRVFSPGINRTRGGRKATRGGGGATKRAEVVDEDAALAAGHRVRRSDLDGACRFVISMARRRHADKKTRRAIAAGDIRLGGLL